MNTTLEELRSHQEEIALLGDDYYTPLDPSPAQEQAWTIIKRLNTTTTSECVISHKYYEKTAPSLISLAHFLSVCRIYTTYIHN